MSHTAFTGVITRTIIWGYCQWHNKRCWLLTKVSGLYIIKYNLVYIVYNVKKVKYYKEEVITITDKIHGCFGRKGRRNEYEENQY